MDFLNDFGFVMASSFLNIILNKRGNVIYDFDIQDFEGLNFKIKVETIIDEEDYAKLSFVDKDNNPIDILFGIFCKDFSNKKLKEKKPFSGCNFFLLNQSRKYVFYFDPENKNLKDNRIYIINCEHKKYFQIFNLKPKKLVYKSDTSV